MPYGSVTARRESVDAHVERLVVQLEEGHELPPPSRAPAVSPMYELILSEMRKLRV